jgi:hypothetical protein
MFICPKCNVETDDKKKHRIHGAERKFSLEVAALIGALCCLFFFFVGGLFWRIFTSPPPHLEETGAWIFVFAAALVPPLIGLAVAVKSLVRAKNLAGSPNPTYHLSQQTRVLGWSWLIVFVLLSAIAALQVVLR